MSRIFLIAYDLNKGETSSEYKRLIDQIKKLGSWAKPLESTWFVISESSASEIIDYLKKFIDSNDELLVMDVTDDDWATMGINKEVTDWMKENI